MSAGAGPQASNYPFGFAYGLNVQGLPILNTYGGVVYWVHSVTGADGNDGTFQRPFATLDRAMSFTSASRGDYVMVKPGHVETISSATALAMDIAGVSVVGLGVGLLRPTFTLDTATTTTINVTAAAVTFTNCLFIANFAGIVSPFTLGAAKAFGLFGCEFRDTSASLNFVNLVDTNTTSFDANDLTIAGCKRLGLGADTGTTIVKMDGTNQRVVIKDNYFTHAAVSDAGLMPIATGKVITDTLIDNNICSLVGATGATTGILITTNGTTNSGMISRNLVQSLDATTEILVTASSGFLFSQNFYSAVADKSGYLLPAADA